MIRLTVFLADHGRIIILEEARSTHKPSRNREAWLGFGLDLRRLGVPDVTRRGYERVCGKPIPV